MARFPVSDMRFPGLDELVVMTVMLEVTIEVGIGQEVLRGIGATLQAVRAWTNFTFRR